MTVSSAVDVLKRGRRRGDTATVGHSEQRQRQVDDWLQSTGRLVACTAHGARGAKDRNRAGGLHSERVEHLQLLAAASRWSVTTG